MLSLSLCLPLFIVRMMEMIIVKMPWVIVVVRKKWRGRRRVKCLCGMEKDEERNLREAMGLVWGCGDFGEEEEKITG